MNTLRTALGGVMLATSAIAIACGHDETPPASPVVATATIAPVVPASAAPSSKAAAPPSSAAPAPSAAASAAPWGRDDGDDPLAARGEMWGDAIGDSFGAGGLGLSGVDADGGGGRGEGIGLGSIGTLGGVRDGGAPHGSAPKLRQGATTVTGRLPPEVIQRIVRQNFGRFRLCYENGLRKNDKLAGKITVKFVIDPSGAVTSAKDGGSDLGDSATIACVVRAFTNMSFPQPEGGSVTVAYPILFSPGDPPKKK